MGYEMTRLDALRHLATLDPGDKYPRALVWLWKQADRSVVHIPRIEAIRMCVGRKLKEQMQRRKSA